MDVATPQEAFGGFRKMVVEDSWHGRLGTRCASQGRMVDWGLDSIKKINEVVLAKLT